MKVDNVTIRKGDNGYVLEWYGEDSHMTIHPTFEEASAQLQLIFLEVKSWTHTNSTYTSPDTPDTCQKRSVGRLGKKP